MSFYKRQQIEAYPKPFPILFLFLLSKFSKSLTCIKIRAFISESAAVPSSPPPLPALLSMSYNLKPIGAGIERKRPSAELRRELAKFALKMGKWHL